jgi:hypothetical protein
MELRTEVITVFWDKDGGYSSPAILSFGSDKLYLGWNISEMGLLIETKHAQYIHPWHRIRRLEISKIEGTVTERIHHQEPNVEELPEAECKFGYPMSQVPSVIGEEREEDFFKFIRGQTLASCSGKKYDSKKGRYVPTNCGPHGIVIYTVDVINFIKGLPVTD